METPAEDKSVFISLLQVKGMRGMKAGLWLMVLVLFISGAISVRASPQIDWLESQQDLFSTGLLDSYEGDGNNLAYIYDQALAVIAFTEAGKLGRAKKILDRMEGLQDSQGRWYECYDASNGNLGRWDCDLYNTGPIAWVVMAINFYELETRDTQYAGMAEKALGWLDSMRVTNQGDERHGSLKYCTGNACTIPNAVSTEHNLDAYSAYLWRWRLSGNIGYKDNANLIREYLVQEMWAPSNMSNGTYHNVNVFWRGFDDFVWCTDCQSWSVLSLGPTGPNGEEFWRSLGWLHYSYWGSTRNQKDYNSTIQDVDGFEPCTEDQDHVWLEGTEGVAAAFYSIGDNANYSYFHNQTGRVVSSNGGIIHTFNESGDSEKAWPGNWRYNSVASTSWYYFNERGVNPFAPDFSNWFVSVNRTRFYLYGEPFYFSGANNYYLFYRPWNQVEEVLDDAKAMNLKVLRTWGFCDGMRKEGYSFQPEPGVYDELGFQRMDMVIKEAGDRGIKLMIALVNNWGDFGGMCQYARWCNESIPDYNSCSPHAGPGTAGSGAHDAFYTNNCTRELYKNYIAYFLNRTNSITGIKYKDDPAIFAWQLANEPRARSDPSGQTLYNWISEMSSYIKTIDSNHLVTTGEDGFYKNKSNEYGYAGYDGQDFISHHQIPSIDFASMHMYPWGSYYTYENMLKWIEEHAVDANTIIRKPLTLNEFGVKGSLRDEYMSGFYKKIEDSGISGDLFWILCHDAYPDYDGYCVYPGDSSIPIITSHSDIMNSKNDTNNFPIIEPIGNIRVNETQLVRIIVNATDPDGDSLAYYIDDSRYIQNGNVFEWQTQAGDKGIYSVTVRVNDGSKVNISRSLYVIVREEKPCSIPTDGMVITESITFCLDIYYLPNGVRSGTNNPVNIDCDGSILIGNGSKSGINAGFDNGSIRNCEIRNYANGIYLSYGINDLIENNKLIYNKYYALYLNRGSYNTVINNIISHTNNYVGLQLYDSHNNTITYNDISHHDKGIWHNSYGNNFSYNNIHNNGNWNFVIPWAYNVSAEYNWWGSISKTEIASKIYDCTDNSQLGCVDFIPYLCEQYPTSKTAPCLDGDVNWDCQVDIFDLAAVGLCYGCLEAQGCWGNCEQVDVHPVSEGNGKIDIFDLATVGLNYGGTC